MICDDRLRIGGPVHEPGAQSGKSDIESFSFILQVNVCADLFHDESPWIVFVSCDLECGERESTEQQQQQSRRRKASRRRNKQCSHVMRVASKRRNFE